MVRIRSAIFGHNNDYGPHPLTPVERLHPISVCCVVPYYETGPLGLEVVRRLTTSLVSYQRRFADPPPVAVTVVDDGSQAAPFPGDRTDETVAVIQLRTNQGRSAARNTGLRAAAAAGFDMTVFVDSDVLVSIDQIEQIVRLWSLRQRPDRPDPCVVANMFTTLTTVVAPDELEAVVRRSTVELDWRVECRYQTSWIGCSSDWAYVGQRFKLVEQTRQFRDWSGMVGPWCLPNMVLGGGFAVPTRPAIAVGGFDESFAAYGFTETTLVARLVAVGLPVIPQLESAAVHVEWNPTHLSQADRNVRFRSAHHKFFTDFLGNEL